MPRRADTRTRLFKLDVRRSASPPVQASDTALSRSSARENCCARDARRARNQSPAPAADPSENARLPRHGEAAALRERLAPHTDAVHARCKSRRVDRERLPASAPLRRVATVRPSAPRSSRFIAAVPEDRNRRKAQPPCGRALPGRWRLGQAADRVRSLLAAQPAPTSASSTAPPSTRTGGGGGGGTPGTKAQSCRMTARRGPRRCNARGAHVLHEPLRRRARRRMGRRAGLSGRFAASFNAVPRAVPPETRVALRAREAARPSCLVARRLPAPGTSAEATRMSAGRRRRRGVVRLPQSAAARSASTRARSASNVSPP